MNSNIKSPIISLSVYDIKSPREKAIRVNGRPFCSLSYRKSGAANFNIGGKAFVSEADCITLMPAGQSYYTEIIEDTHIISIHFNPLDKKMFTETFTITNNDRQLQQLFDLIMDNYSAENEINYECYSCFYKILAKIEQHFIKKRESKINPVILRAKSEIDKNFANASFNIDALVSTLPVCASHLRNEFSKAYSISPIKYLKYVRLQNAKSLLASNYYSVNEVAKRSGFSGTSYFIQSFTKSVGISPLKYKEKVLTQEGQNKTI